MRALAILLAVVACSDPTPTASAQPASPARKPITYRHNAMGTMISVWVWSKDEKAVSMEAKKLWDEMDRLDLLMSNFKPESEIGQLNTNAGVKPVKVSDETLAVIERAIDVSKRSAGVFDITVGAYKGLWKFDDDMDEACRLQKPDCKLPEASDVDKRRKLVNWKDIVVDSKKKTVFLKRKGMAVTLGGIAKGYAVDKCVEILAKDGFKDFMFQAGGDMYISGSKDDKPWMIGIRDPRGPADSMFAVGPIKDHSFSTSGDYERGFVKDGVRYHHILDPRTGRPATASRSVTIRAKDAFTADAWSKVMFIYGWKDGMDIIKREKLDDFEVVWVDDKNEIHSTSAIEKDLKIIKQPSPGP
jgi:thiamine biosynthesis lipoprotein